MRKATKRKTIYTNDKRIGGLCRKYCRQQIHGCGLINGSWRMGNMRRLLLRSSGWKRSKGW
jgi:hypothetical protein